MASIRTYEGTIFVCGKCGQPAFNSSSHGPEHFMEQWDGVYCPRFPLAGQLLPVEWDESLLRDVKANYIDSYPRRWSAVR